VYSDRQMKTNIDVHGHPAGPSQRETCGAQPAVQAEAGTSSEQSASYRISATAFCRSWGTVGGEFGRVFNRHEFLSSGFTKNGNIWTSTSDSRQRKLYWSGAFAEFPFSLPLNPRVVTSVGYYRLADRTERLTSVYDTTAKTNSASLSSSQAPRSGIGAGLGLAIAMPLWQRVSLGLEERTHFSVGGNATTVAVTVRVRP
jgi:hypothetical protein